MQITAINIYARKVVQTTRRDILWKLWSCNSITNQPESEIASGHIDTSDVSTTSSWTSLSITPVTISAGTKYAIGIASPSVAGNDSFYISTAASPYDSYFIDGGRYDTVGITMNGTDVPSLKLQVYIDSVLVGNQGGSSYANYSISGLPNQPSYLFNVFQTSPQEKAINPTPLDEAINVTTYPSVTLQWEHGDSDYPPDSYKVYVGGGTWLDLAGEGAILGLVYSGHIYGPKTYGRVDAIYGGTTITGDVWEFTPSETQSYTFTLPSDPTPLTGSSTGYFSGVACKWNGDSRSSTFEIWSSINGGTDTLRDTTTSRAYTMTGLTAGQTITWHVKEKVILNSPSAWIEGPSWTFTVQTASYPGSDGTEVSGAVPSPNILKTIAVADNKVYYGRLTV